MNIMLTTQTRLYPQKLLKNLYWHMLRIRAIEETLANLYAEQEMRCPVHLCIGQEAISAGVAAVVRKEDLMLSNHRAHGHYLAKGGDVRKMFAELYGKATGCAGGRGGSMHLIDLSVNFLGATPIVASIIPVATGVAFAEKIKKKKTVTVVFFGEAAIEEGVCHESLNFATLKKLPILFVCENNLYSVYTPLKDRQPPRSITRLAAGHGLLAKEIDGNDVLAVYKNVKDAFSYILQGKGPVFLEFPTYRWREHCGPNFDNHIGYREEKEYLLWKKKDPVEQFKRLLTNQEVIDQKELLAIETRIKIEIETIVRKVKTDPLPTQLVTVADVYAK